MSASQRGLWAQEAGLEGRAAGASLLGVEVLGEQTKAAREVVGHPASPGGRRAMAVVDSWCGFAAL